MAESAQKLKKAKKRWIKILASQIFGEGVIGESPVMSPNELLGRKLKYNLMNITGDPKKQSINVIFQVVSVGADSVNTEIIGFETSTSALKRAVRRDKEKIDDSFLVITADKKNTRAKIMIITINSVKKSILTRIRKEAYKMMISFARKKSFIELVDDLLSKKIQKEMRSKLSKIYPLKVCEIRTFKLEKPKKEISEADIQNLQNIADEKNENEETPEDAAEESDEPAKHKKDKHDTEQKEDIVFNDITDTTEGVTQESAAESEDEYDK